MPTYGDPITPDPLDLHFRDSSTVTYFGPRTGVGADWDGSGGAFDTMATYGVGYSAVWNQETPRDVTSTDVDTADGLIKNPTPTPDAPWTVGGAGGSGAYRWSIDNKEDPPFLGAYDNKHVKATAEAGVRVPFYSFHEGRDINLQTGPVGMTPWSPAVSGHAWPVNAVGWEIVDDASILSQSIKVKVEGVSGYIDGATKIVFAYVPAPGIPASGTLGLGVTKEIQTKAELITILDAVAGTEETIALPSSLRPYVDATDLDACSEIVTIPSMALAGAPAPMAGLPAMALPGTPYWEWRYSVADGTVQEEEFDYSLRFVFDYVWQPPTFQWVYEDMPAPVIPSGGGGWHAGVIP